MLHVGYCHEAQKQTGQGFFVSERCCGGFHITHWFRTHKRAARCVGEILFDEQDDDVYGERIEQFKNFADYVLEFYGTSENAVYPMGATRKLVERAINTLIDRRKASGGPDFCFDTVDREAVRDILIEQFGLKMPPAPLRVVS